jgi:hypothetical protein
MNADPKRKSRQGDYDRVSRARQHQEEALDDALKNTFPASDPVSIEQPTSSAATRLGNISVSRPISSKTNWSAFTAPVQRAHQLSGVGVVLARPWKQRTAGSTGKC